MDWVLRVGHAIRYNQLTPYFLCGKVVSFSFYTGASWWIALHLLRLANFITNNLLYESDFMTCC